MTALQLNPPLQLRHKDGRKCIALLLIDYGPETDSVLLVGFAESRELWYIRHSDLRLDDNITFGRAPCNNR